MTPRFRRVLQARRDAWNAEVARRGGTVPPAALLAYLARTADPLVDAAGDTAADAVAQALFALGLQGLPAGHVGEQGPTPLETALVEHLPRFGDHFRGAARRLVPALANGYVRMARERSADSARWWVGALADASSRCATFDLVLAAGVVLAWRAGIAEARAAALRHLGGMEVRLREALVGAAEVDPDPRRRFVPPGSRADLGPVELLGRVGGFSGFGGDFALPPVVRASGEQLFATDGQTVRALYADVFGARLRPVSPAVAAALPGDSGADAIAVAADGAVRWDGVEGRFPALAGATSACGAAGVLAVTVPDSHAVFVLGRRAASS